MLLHRLENTSQHLDKAETKNSNVEDNIVDLETKVMNTEKKMAALTT